MVHLWGVGQFLIKRDSSICYVSRFPIMKILPSFIAVSGLIAFVVHGEELAADPASRFGSAVAEYQKSPSGEAATKVINIAATMEQFPAVPEEARKHVVMGKVMLEEAKSPEAVALAASEFSQAIQVAPWFPDAHLSLAFANEARGDYANAIAGFKIYQLFKLTDEQARKVQDKIYAIEAKIKMRQVEVDKATAAAAEEAASNARRQSSERAKADEIRRASTRKIGFLEGEWRCRSSVYDEKMGHIGSFDKDETALIKIVGKNVTISTPSGTFTVNGSIVGEDYTTIAWSVPVDDDNRRFGMESASLRVNYADSGHRMSFKLPSAHLTGNPTRAIWDYSTYRMVELSKQ
jgi:hypothetical protein